MTYDKFRDCDLLVGPSLDLERALTTLKSTPNGIIRGLFNLQFLRNKPSGEYLFEYSPGLPPVKLYFDLSRPNEIWIRTCYKKGTSIYPTEPNFQWNSEMINSFLKRIKDFGVSDHLETIYTEESWLIRDVTMSPAKTVEYGKYKTDLNLSEFLTNILNGQTPTGTQWHQEYDGGYVFFEGTFMTFGNWTKMYEGANRSSYWEVNTKRSLRCGGHIHHTGEFIHSSCNGYDTKDHSVTARVSWNNTRVFWFRIE